MRGLFAVMMCLGAPCRMSSPRFTTLELIGACGLMPATAAALSQIGTLRLLTIVIPLATAALQLPLRCVLGVSGAIAPCSLVVLAKVVASNLVGAQMRAALAAINDRLGHAMVTDVLRAFAKIVTGRLRGTDRIARDGGEAFLLLLTNTPDAASAQLAGERLRCAVKEHPWSDLTKDLAVTCSIGLTMSRAGEGVAEMLERVGAALYRAKSDGRNVVRLG